MKLNTFGKIKLLNKMPNRLGEFGTSCRMALVEYIDGTIIIEPILDYFENINMNGLSISFIKHKLDDDLVLFFNKRQSEIGFRSDKNIWEYHENDDFQSILIEPLYELFGCEVDKSVLKITEKFGNVYLGQFHDGT
jgi:hypothetical protein